MMRSEEADQPCPCSSPEWSQLVLVDAKRLECIAHRPRRCRRDGPLQEQLDVALLQKGLHALALGLAAHEGLEAVLLAATSIDDMVLDLVAETLQLLDTRAVPHATHALERVVRMPSEVTKQ